MKFKRTMAMVMATAMMLGLAACGGGSLRRRQQLGRFECRRR